MPERSADYPLLRYHGGKRNNRGVKAQYLRWRAEQDPPLPERCDNPECRFYREARIWNGRRLPLILDHKNGVNTDNRTKNLQLLCANCDSQNSKTRGGANIGRTTKHSGGFVLNESGIRSYVMPVETGFFELR